MGGAPGENPDTSPEFAGRAHVFKESGGGFTTGSILAVEKGKSFDYIPELKDDYVKDLEAEMDRMDARLPEMRNFVLPGGHPLISYCHIARCVCRRAERCVNDLNNVEAVDDVISGKAIGGGNETHCKFEIEINSNTVASETGDLIKALEPKLKLGGKIILTKK